MARRMSELVIDCRDPARLAASWYEVLGFAELERVDGSIEIGPEAGFGRLQPTIVFEPGPGPRGGKLPLHFDVSPVGCAQAAELARLLADEAGLVFGVHHDDPAYRAATTSEGQRIRRAAASG